MQLVINGVRIQPDLPKILNRVKAECGRNVFKDIHVITDNLLVTCPHHKDGMEHKPSCTIYSETNSTSVIFGTAHCFACGYTAPLYSVVAECFGKTDDFGKKWLTDNFGEGEVEYDLKPIELDTQDKPQFLPTSTLDKYNFYHDYMWKRKLSREVVDKFCVGYDKDAECITFPVWDEHGNLVMITKRSVNSKQFFIPKGVQKPVYLLNFIDKEKPVCVCESQINALTLWGWGYQAVALFGTGSQQQYQILRDSGIRTYILCLDGDDAGDSGIIKLKKALGDKEFIAVKQTPRDGRDLNDLTKQQFYELKIL